MLYTITVTGDELETVTPVITGFTVTPNTLPAQVSITFVDNVLTFQAPDLIGLLPILSIKYLLNGVEYQVNDWNLLPAQAEEVLEYLKDPNSPKIFDLAVTAQATTTETVTYQFIVRANYTPGRDRLVQEVNARL